MQGDDNEQDEQIGISVLTESIVLYVDFLGVSDAARSWPEHKVGALINVLRNIHEQRSPFSIDGFLNPDGGYRFQIKPETSTFSDHVVSSYPLSEVKRFVPAAEKILNEAYVELAARRAAQIAQFALEVGLLVRGGLSIGPLYHHDGVVFGPSLVEAYKLESRTAQYPRVVVSPSIVRMFPGNLPPSVLADSDGVYHLNYIRNMILLTEPEKKLSWVTDQLKFADSELARFDTDRTLNEYAKWYWFRRELADVESELNNQP